MENGILEKNEIFIKESLLTNSLDFLDLYLDFLDKKDFNSKDIKVGLFSLCSFYECIFKFLIRNEEILNDPIGQLTSKEITSQIFVNQGKEYTNEDFSKGEVQTISLRKCMDIFLDKGIISRDDKELILKHNKIRNSFTHLELTGNESMNCFYHEQYEDYGLLLNIQNFYDEGEIISKILAVTLSLVAKAKEIGTQYNSPNIQAPISRYFHSFVLADHAIQSRFNRLIINSAL